jgi:DNA polymerase-1
MKQRYLSLLDEIKNNPSKPMKLDDHVLVIDGLNNFIRCFSAIPMMSDNGNHIGGLVGFLRSLGYVIKLMHPTRILIIFDGKGGSQKRKKIYPEYKAGRAFKGLNRKVAFNNLDHEKKSMFQQMSRLQEYMDCLPLQYFSLDHMEADDVIAYVANKGNFGRCTIMSTDKDFLQLVSDTVNVYSPSKKKLYTTKTLMEEYDIHPENFLMYRMVDGDKSDNINGVRGIGLKTLMKLCPEMSTEPMSLSEVVSRDSRLQDNLDILKRNFELMQLSDVDISGSSKGKILDFVDQRPNSLNSYKFRQMYIEDGFSNEIRNLEVWLRENWAILDNLARNG